MSHGNELARTGGRTTSAEPDKTELTTLLVAGIVAWLCLEIWFNFLYSNPHHEVNTHVTNLVALASGICFATMAIVIVFFLKIKHAAWFACFIIIATAILFLAPLTTTLFHHSEWIIVTKNTISISVKSLSIIVLALILANKLPTPIHDQLRLRIPQRPIVAFALPLLAWLVFSYIISKIFLFSSVEVHAQKHIVEQVKAIGNNPIFALAILSIVVPIEEEILFRGFMVQILRKVSNVVFAIVLSAIMFTFMHIAPSLTSLHLNIYVFCMGLLLATTSASTKSVWPAAVVHSVNNTFVIYEVALA